jgi:hypothetical protein
MRRAKRLPSIVFQGMLHTGVKAHLARFQTMYALKYDPKSLYLRSLSLRIPWEEPYIALNDNKGHSSLAKDQGQEKHRASSNIAILPLVSRTLEMSQLEMAHVGSPFALELIDCKCSGVSFPACSS